MFGSGGGGAGKAVAPPIHTRTTTPNAARKRKRRRPLRHAVHARHTRKQFAAAHSAVCSRQCHGVTPRGRSPRLRCAAAKISMSCLEGAPRQRRHTPPTFNVARPVKYCVCWGHRGVRRYARAAYKICVRRRAQKVRAEQLREVVEGGMAKG